MRVAVVGSGVSGLVAAHLLDGVHEVTLIEAAARLGGHANTVPVTVAGEEVWVDTGFLVYNERNYPGLVGLFDELDVATDVSDMSFSVRDDDTGLEWNGTTLNTLFAQRRRIVDRRFLGMLADVARFNRRARHLLADGDRVPLDYTLDTFVRDGGHGEAFRTHYLIPMGAAIWSADPTTFGAFPAVTFARFFENHGLLGLGNRPQWRTVRGGSRRYVAAIAERFTGEVRLGAPVDSIERRTGGVGVDVAVGGETDTFDAVVLATHSDQSLAMLAAPTPAERSVLGAIRYQPNVATLHTDASLLPRARRAWASWNAHVASDGGTDRATLTYHLNRLQNLDGCTAAGVEVCVTLNRPDAPRPDAVVAHIHYAHPVFDTAAVTAQARHAEISGVDRIHYAGAYWGYGFHEDGLQSGVRVAGALGALPRRRR